MNHQTDELNREWRSHIPKLLTTRPDLSALAVEQIKSRLSSEAIGLLPDKCVIASAASADAEKFGSLIAALVLSYEREPLITYAANLDHFEFLILTVWEMFGISEVVVVSQCGRVMSGLIAADKKVIFYGW